MKLEDILILAKAGFTAEQIAALTNEAAPAQPAAPEQSAAPAQPAAPAAPAQPAAPAAPAPAPAQELPRPSDPNEGYKQMMDAISELSSTIKASNIMGSSQPAQQSVDDILASIINPRGSH